MFIKDKNTKLRTYKNCTVNFRENKIKLKSAHILISLRYSMVYLPNLAARNKIKLISFSFFFKFRWSAREGFPFRKEKYFFFQGPETF